MSTIKDIAEEAGVSVATVSNVINKSRYVSSELTKKVEEAIDKLGYRPNHLGRGLRKGKSNTIALVVSDIANPFFPKVARGVEDCVRENQHCLILSNTDDDPEEEEKYISLLCSQRIDGLILAPSDMTMRSIETVAEQEIPLVIIDRPIQGLNLTQVVSDNLGGAYKATEHLLRLGHKKIAFVGGVPGVTSTDQRLEGYKKALEDNSIKVDDSLIAVGNSQVEDSYNATEKLLKTDSNFTAIFAANNLAAIGVLRRLQQSGIACPDDISLICFDDPDWANAVSPRLSVVAQKPYEIGQQAARILFEQIFHDQEVEESRTITLPVTVKIRESTKRVTEDIKNDSVDPSVNDGGDNEE